MVTEDTTFPTNSWRRQQFFAEKNHQVVGHGFGLVAVPVSSAWLNGRTMHVPCGNLLHPCARIDHMSQTRSRAVDGLGILQNTTAFSNTLLSTCDEHFFTLACFNKSTYASIVSFCAMTRMLRLLFFLEHIVWENIHLAKRQFIYQPSAHALRE